jgi:hypothetical protein
MLYLWLSSDYTAPELAMGIQWGEHIAVKVILWVLYILPHLLVELLTFLIG